MRILYHIWYNMPSSMFHMNVTVGRCSAAVLAIRYICLQNWTFCASLKAVLRKWQGCGKLDGILRTERNRLHGYLQTIQMASLPGRDYFAVCALVPPVSAQLPRSRGDDVRAGIAHRSHHHLPLGVKLRARTGEALSAPSQGDE